MDVDRLSTGEKIAGASAVLLFIFMFFDWFSADVEGGLISVDVGNAWDTLDLIPIILMVAIIAAVAVAIIRLTDALFEPPISMNAVVAILGAISVLLILYRIINPPDSGVPTVDIGPALGIFLSLIAAAGLTYGGYRAMQEEGSSFAELGDQFSNRGGSGGGPTQPPASTPPPPPPPPSSGQGGPPPQ
jgi:hypothetical protein